MLEEMCGYIHNYFMKSIKKGTFTISDGALTVDDAQDGQYIRIIGSVFNDGVYRYPITVLTDEEFNGEVWLLAIPKAFLALADEIENWITENEAVISSPYQSESFGGYSYSKGTGKGGNGDSTLFTWQDMFANKLNRWRKLA